MFTNSVRIAEAACRTLCNYSDGTFPVSPLQIAKRMGVRVVDLADIKELLSFIGHDAAFESPAFTLAYGGQKYIVIDRSKGDKTLRRLWLAHEIGHIVLGGSMDADATDLLQLFHGTFRRSLLELSCDLFAVCLLAPPALLAMVGVHSAADIVRICQVSHTVAHLISGAIHLRGDAYQPEDAEAWERLAHGLRERVRQVRLPFGQAPAWFASDISAELTN